jgi:hypothetical protein
MAKEQPREYLACLEPDDLQLQRDRDAAVCDFYRELAERLQAQLLIYNQAGLPRDQVEILVNQMIRDERESWYRYLEATVHEYLQIGEGLVRKLSPFGVVFATDSLARRAVLWRMGIRPPTEASPYHEDNALSGTNASLADVNKLVTIYSQGKGHSYLQHQLDKQHDMHGQVAQWLRERLLGRETAIAFDTVALQLNGQINAQEFVEHVSSPCSYQGRVLTKVEGATEEEKIEKLKQRLLALSNKSLIVVTGVTASHLICTGSPEERQIDDTGSKQYTTFMRPTVTVDGLGDRPEHIDRITISEGYGVDDVSCVVYALICINEISEEQATILAKQEVSQRSSLGFDINTRLDGSEGINEIVRSIYIARMPEVSEACQLYGPEDRSLRSRRRIGVRDLIRAIAYVRGIPWDIFADMCARLYAK